MKNLSKYINICTESVKAHREATEKGNYRLTNKYYDDAMRGLEEVLKFGDAGREEVLKLLQHEDIGVQLWAAMHSLTFNEEQALKVLESISRKKSIFRYDAELIIEKWKNGTLKIT